MAIIFQDDFESYPLGETIDDGGALAAVWEAPEPHHFGISTTQEHNGTQSMFDDEGGNVVQKQVYPGGVLPYGSVDYWNYCTDVNGAFTGARISSDGGSWFFGFLNSLHTTTLRYFNSLDGTIVVVPNAYILNQWQHFRMVWRLSTVLPDGSDVAADGCCQVYVDDVLVVNATGQRLATINNGWVDASSPNTWDFLQFFTARSYLDEVVVTDDAYTCGSVGGSNPPPGSTPCCGEHLPPGTPNPGTPPNRPPTLQPWNRECAGGGVVPQAADLTDAESWSL